MMQTAGTGTAVELASCTDMDWSAIGTTHSFEKAPRIFRKSLPAWVLARAPGPLGPLVRVRQSRRTSRISSKHHLGMHLISSSFLLSCEASGLDLTGLSCLTTVIR